jgi:hypothetical protein
MLTIALQYAAAASPKTALATQTECYSFAIFTTDVNGTNNENHYASKPEVYLNGGPGPSGQLPEGTVIYYRVEEPDGTPLSEIRQTVAEADGTFFVQLAPFDTTSNSGNEYSVTASQRADLKPGDCTKNDNFKVDGPGTLTVTKTVEGGESDGKFPFSVDCGIAGDFEGSLVDGGSVSFEVDALAECEVTEGTLPAPPEGYEWGEVDIDPNPVTVESGDEVEVTITNHLIRQTGSLKITKVIPDVPEGYEGSFGVRVTCDEGDPVNAVIEFPDPGFVTVDDLPAGAECAVIETTKSDPPEGFQFGGANINGPVTIVAGQTAEITVTNPLIELQGTPVLTIDKSNDAPGAGVNPPLEVGDTVTYTLDYDVTKGPDDNGIITDVLPDGVTYVNGSASSDAQFTFIDFGVTTPGALTWKAATVTTDGTLTYDVTIDADAAGKPQPLVNTATIESDDTAPDSDTSQVFVPAPPLAETAPPTDVAGATDSSVPGGSLLLVLLALAGIALAVAFAAPTPASLRKRIKS